MIIINVLKYKVRMNINININVYFSILAFWKIVNKFDEKDEVISYFLKLGLKPDINFPSSIIYQFPSGDPKKFKSYEFPLIEESFLQEKSLTKYEIPQYIPDIPEGFSLFCTLWEASKVKQYMLLSQEEQEKLNIKENFEKKEKENNLEEPIPKSNYCYICQKKFEDYLIHIESKKHKINLSNQNYFFFRSIKNSFKHINKFWNNTISIDEDISYDSSEEINESKKSNEKENIKITSTFIAAINEEDTQKKENDKENIDLNLNKNEIGFEGFKYNYGNNFSNINNKEEENKKRISKFKLLKKKRITFDVIRYESPTKKNNCEIKRRDYFGYLNKYKTKKFIRNINILFE